MRRDRMRAVVIDAFGGPEVLQVRRVPRPIPGPGETLIRSARAGVNYTDLGRRASGWRSRVEAPPVILGWEVAGTRVDDGTRVVGLLTSGTGGYAEYAVAPDEYAVPIPAGVSDTAAVAVLVQGITAWHLLVTSARLREGETVAVTAAAGGVGTLALQLARLLGARRVIGVASTAEKRRLALDLGADEAVDGAPDGLADRLRAANGGEPVDVVLESVAGPVVDEALDALAFDGRLVVYGQASGASNTVSLDLLMDRSIGVAGYWAAPAMRDRAGTRRVVERLLDHVASGRLRVVEGPAYRAADAAIAHEAIAARGTVGKVTLETDEDAWTPAAPSRRSSDLDDSAAAAPP
jgi:NADPH2:quinone reductase